MSNEEFDMLRAELYWAGSKIAILRCEPAPAALQNDC